MFNSWNSPWNVELSIRFTKYLPKTKIKLAWFCRAESDGATLEMYKCPTKLGLKLLLLSYSMNSNTVQWFLIGAMLHDDTIEEST